MKNMGNFLKQAQQMQSRMAQLQEELEHVTATGEAGGGMVSITMNGKQMVRQVKIDPTVVDPDDLEMLEDLIAAACNDAQQKIQQATQARVQEIAGGLNIPGMNLGL